MGRATELVTGKSGVAVAENHYFLPKVSNWDSVQAHSATKNYSAGGVILHGGQFLQARFNCSSAFNSANWTDVTSAVNDLNSVGSGALADSFWTKIDMSVTNSTYWSEIGHANGATDFDSNYWQQIKPGMNRFDDSEAGTQISSTDYSIWAQVGSVGGDTGTKFGAIGTLRKNQFPNDGNFIRNMDQGSANQGDYVQSGTKIFQARVATTGDPGATGVESDWHAVADTATMSSASVSEQANRRQFTDTNFGLGTFPIRIKTPVTGRL